MEKLKLSSQNADGTIYHQEVDAERIMIKDLECFIFIDPEETEQGEVKGYNVSHLETGMRMASDLSKEWAIKKATTNYEKYPECIEKGETNLQR